MPPPHEFRYGTELLKSDDNFKKIFHKLIKDNAGFTQWVNTCTKKSHTGLDISDDYNQNREVFYKEILRFNKQSLAFYIEILPFFYQCIQKSKISLYNTHTLLDVGCRTGAGSNFFGELFCDESWGYPIKLLVDTIDIKYYME